MSYYNSPKQYEDATGKRFTKKLDLFAAVEKEKNNYVNLLQWRNFCR